MDCPKWPIVRSGTSRFAIVTQDVDLAELAGLLGCPPKVIWLRVGNHTTAMIADLLRRHAPTIQAFEGDDSAACLEIYPLV